MVERTFAWLHPCKRLRTRYERRADITTGLLHLACVLICHRFPAALVVFDDLDAVDTLQLPAKSRWPGSFTTTVYDETTATHLSYTAA